MLLWFELFLWLTSSMHLPTVLYRCMHEVFFWWEINKSESTKTLRLGWLNNRSANKVPETSKPRPSAGILRFLWYLLGSANYRVSHPPIEYFNIFLILLNNSLWLKIKQFFKYLFSFLLDTITIKNNDEIFSLIFKSCLWDHGKIICLLSNVYFFVHDRLINFQIFIK